MNKSKALRIRPASLMRELITSFRHHSWLILPSVIYIGICAGICRSAGYPIINSGAFIFCGLLLLTIAIALVIGHAVWVVAIVRPKQPLPLLISRIRNNFSRDRCITALPVILLFGPFSVAFSQAKYLIPKVNPYAWDSTFSNLDTLLHLGIQPWQWLAPLLLNGPVVSVITVFYTGVWFLAGFSVLGYVSLDTARPQKRMQFLLSYFGCWAILGTLAATTLSSAGPAYFENFGTPAKLYLPLMSQLRSLDAAGWLTPIRAIDLVWHSYATPNITPTGFGMSAMPSLHVAIAFLLYLYARSFGTLVKSLAGVFFGVILVGSVLFGWHYAVDGYASVIGVLGIWWVSGHIARATVGRSTNPGSPPTDHLKVQS